MGYCRELRGMVVAIGLEPVTSCAWSRSDLRLFVLKTKVRPAPVANESLDQLVKAGLSKEIISAIAESGFVDGNATLPAFE
jgi:hypothetical protein